MYLPGSMVTDCAYSGNRSWCPAAAAASYQAALSDQKICLTIGLLAKTSFRVPACTISDLPVFETYGKPEPHSLQKAFEMQRPGTSNRFT